MERAFQMGYACALHDLGYSDRAVGKAIGRHHSLVAKWRRCAFNYARKKGSGRPRCTTDRGDRAIVALACADATASTMEIATQSGVSKCTVFRRLKEKKLSCRNRPSAIPLTNRHKVARMTWAIRHCLWRERHWGRVVWSDEASVWLRCRDRRLKVWIRSNQQVPKAFVFPAVAGGGGRLLMWAAIWTDGRTSLHVMNNTMNSDRYKQVLSAHVPRMILQLGEPQRHWFFMDDNAPCHRSKDVQQHKELLRLRCIEWPARSPDLNPIESVWSLLKKNVRRRLHPKCDLQDLAAALRAEWEAIPMETVNNLIASMTRRVGEVLRAEGANTRY